MSLAMWPLSKFNDPYLLAIVKTFIPLETVPDVSVNAAAPLIEAAKSFAFQAKAFFANGLAGEAKSCA